MKSMKKLLFVFGILLCTVVSMYAESNTKTVEGYYYAGATKDVLEINAFGETENRQYKINDSVKIIDENGKTYGKDSFAKFKQNPLFFVINANNEVFEVYVLPFKYEPGTYDGKGIRFNPENKPSIRYAEGNYQTSIGTNDVRITPFGSKKLEVYPTYDVTFLNENGLETTEFKMWTNATKVRVKLVKINGVEYAREVKMLPPQYKPASAKSENSEANTTVSANTSKSNDDGWESDEFDESTWDGWSEEIDVNQRNYEITEAYGYIKSVTPAQKQITINRKDGKYKNFQIADSSIFDTYNKAKLYNLDGEEISAYGLRKGSYIRYLVKIENSEEKIVEIRVLPENKKLDPYEKVPGDAETVVGTILNKKLKGNLLECVVKYNSSRTNFVVTSDTVFMDMYDRITSLDQISITANCEIIYSEKDGEKILHVMRQLNR